MAKDPRDKAVHVWPQRSDIGRGNSEIPSSNSLPTLTALSHYARSYFTGSLSQLSLSLPLS
eukprot:2310210-Alexandrium_andersonii.AAC.1